MKTVNYGAVQETSLWIEWSGRVLWGRRELRVGGVCGRGEKGKVSASGKGSKCPGNIEQTNLQERCGSK